MAKKEALKRTSKKACSCGYNVRGKEHEAGKHHMAKKSIWMPTEGIKTNVGDPLNNKGK